ncbi:MAG: SemiSWEET transporter [Nanoarchaeota archaeon]|nr:SemiSWEET transporter [Nanoarchaeota archaeon]MBU1631995.1 SemiSWEET transporter [Nanoarchaeota archaeon]MBU1876615.1 SemiSWEET transporter [Nanoarchaeota archaeon]
MVLVTLLGLLAAACTTISFLPQAIKTIKTKQTKDLSLIMYTILTIGIILWLIYGFFIKDLPIILANGITLIFSVTILILIIKYKS